MLGYAQCLVGYLICCFARDSDFYFNLLGCQGRVKQSPVKTKCREILEKFVNLSLCFDGC